MKRIVWLCLPFLLFACQTAVNGNGDRVTAWGTIAGASAAAQYCNSLGTHEEFRTFYRGAALFDCLPRDTSQTATIDLRSFAFRQ